MRGWLGTDTALPMSWQSEATTSSSSAPARSALVAVWRQWVSWSTAKPSTTSDSDSSIISTRSATRPWFLAVSAPISAQSSPVETSMLVNEVVVIVSFSRRSLVRDVAGPAAQPLEHIGRSGGPVGGQHRGLGVGRKGPGPVRVGVGSPIEQRQRRLQRSEQFAELRWGREVLLLDGHRRALHPVDGGQALHHNTG